MSNDRFRIAAAQIASVRGDPATNVKAHLTAIEFAAEQQVSVLIFPELSLTGYEPDLAAQLELHANHELLVPIQTLATEKRVSVVVGAPLQNPNGTPSIGAILIDLDGSIHEYRKMHLGGDEAKYFQPGSNPVMFDQSDQKIGLAVCADSSQSSHPESYAKNNCSIYAAAVFLTEAWYRKDAVRLADYAARHSMLVVMANHANSIGTYASIGKSSIWSDDGRLLAQAADNRRALVVATRHDDSWSGQTLLF